jgi:hypothetical protein
MFISIALGGIVVEDLYASIYDENLLSDLRVKPRRSGRGCKRGRRSLPFFGL